MSLRAWREATARRLAAPYGGVITRAELLQAGVTRRDIETEVRAGRWRPVGRRTIAVLSAALPQWCGGDVPRQLRFEGAPSQALWWWALWETGRRAVLDGATGLIACGMTGFEPDVIDISVPPADRYHELPGVRVTRRRSSGPLCANGISRVAPAFATIRAAAGSQ